MKAVKTLLLVAVFGFVATAALAQKPAAGNIVIEGQINSVFNENSISASTGENSASTFQGLRGRYFLQDNLALRLTLGVSLDTDNDFFIDGNVGKFNDNAFGIAVGIEKHFAGTNRLSPYVGGDIFFSTTSTKYEIEDQNGADPFDTAEAKNVFGNDASSLGVNGVIGADFYFLDNVFLGIEFGLGIQFDSFKDIETTLVNGTTSTSEAPDGSSSFSTTSVYPSAGLRLGFVLN